MGAQRPGSYHQFMEIWEGGPPIHSFWFGSRQSWITPDVYHGPLTFTTAQSVYSRSTPGPAPTAASMIGPCPRVGWRPAGRGALVVPVATASVQEPLLASASVSRSRT